MTTVRMLGTTVGKTGSAPPAPGPGDYPAWRFGKTVNEWFRIPGTANMAGTTTAVAASIDLWNGLAASPDGKLYSALAGGDGYYNNGVHYIDLNVTAPAWATLDAGATDPQGVYRVASPAPNGSKAVVDSAYYLDGKPCGRHTYATTFYVPASQGDVNSVFALTVNAAYGINHLSTDFAAGPQVDRFKLTNNTWDAGGTWTSRPGWTNASDLYPDYGQDPRTGYVYTVGSGGGDPNSTYYKWAFGTWTKFSTTPRYPDPNAIRSGNQLPSLVDGSRNRYVLMHDGRPYDTSRGARLYCIDLSTQVSSIIWITGDLPATWPNDQAIVHDTGNDYYYAFIQRTGATDVYRICPADGRHAGESAGVSVKTHSIESSPVFEGIQRRCAYFSNLGGIAYVPRFSDNVWFLPTV